MSKLCVNLTINVFKKSTSPADEQDVLMQIMQQVVAV